MTEIQSALSAIYREHYAFVWAVLRRLGVPDDEVEDLAQDVFVVVHRRLPEFEGRASIKTWLYAICVRVSWNARRRRRFAESPDNAGTTRVPAVGGDPEVFTARAQAGELLHGLLRRLDPDKRTVFVLSEIEGLPAPEIARIVGAKTRTVYSRLRAARTRFDRDLRRAQARDRSALTARELVRRGIAHDSPPRGSRDRSWAALGLKLFTPTAPTLGALGFAKAAALTLVFAGGGLAVVAVASAPLRAETAQQPVTAPPIAATDETREAADVSAAARLQPSEPAPEAAEAAQTEEASTSNVPSATALESRSRSTPARESRSTRQGEAQPASRSVPSSAPELPSLDPKDAGLLRSARRHLKAGTPAKALEALDLHAKNYPASPLRRERTRTRITVLCALDRGDEARRLAPDAGLGDDFACP